MPKIIYIESTGVRHQVDVPAGSSVMQGAVDNMINGIVAECGGACICATCHCMVDDAWIERTGEASADEKTMLDAVMDRAENSRLSCQISVTEEMEGLVIHLPDSQL